MELTKKELLDMYVKEAILKRNYSFKETFNLLKDRYTRFEVYDVYNEIKARLEEA